MNLSPPTLTEGTFQQVYALRTRKDAMELKAKCVTDASTVRRVKNAKPKTQYCGGATNGGLRGG